MTPNGGAGPRWPFLALSAAHLAACLHHFPPSEIFSGEPVMTSDYVIHFLEAVRVAGYLRQGSFLGYSTAWMAGFPDGFSSMVKNKPFCIAMAMTPEHLQPLVFNLGVLLSLWLFPPLIYAAARAFGHDRRLSAVAMAGATGAYYGSGLFRLFWRGGSVLFVVGSGAALWAMAKVCTLWTERGSSRDALAASLGLAAVLWIHPAAALVPLIGGAATYLATLRSSGLRIARALVLVVVPIALNLPWLWPFIAHADLRGSFYYPIYQGGLDHLAFDFVRGPLHLGTGPRDETAVLAALVVAASAAALAIPWRWLGIATTTAVALAIVSYAGGVFRPTAVLQPYRYVVPLAGLLAIAAAPLWNAARQRKWAAVFLAMVVLVTADRVRVASRSGDYLGAGPSRGDRWALATLRTLQAGAPVAASPGRVLLEGEWTVDAVDGRAAARRVHYSYLSFERLLGGELLGAPAMGIGVPQEHASFWRGRFLGRPLASYDATSFRAACDVYDIAWVLTAREDSLQRLESFGPAVSLVAASGPFGIFRVNRRAKRLWKGRGTAGSDGHTIEAQLPDSSPAVLAYHWIEGLEATPAAELGPIRVDPTSPARFIEIRPPSPGRYRIRLPASGR